MASTQTPADAAAAAGDTECTAGEKPAADAGSETTLAGEAKGEATDDSDDARWEVTWDGPDDPGNPMNLSTARKWITTVICSVGALNVACSSSIYTATYDGIEAAFGASQIEAITGLTLFVFGMGAGPMFYAPLSEFYGRRIIYLISFTFFLAFQFPVAFAHNITGVLVNRLLGGLSGSAFMSVAGGTVADMFPKKDLGMPMMVFTAAPFLGPSIGPLIGDFVAYRTSWRHVFYVMIAWVGTMLVLITFAVPETFAPVLLKRRAIARRKDTGDDRYYAPIERMNRSVLGTVAFSCRRPFELLVRDMMVFCLCLYTSILLGTMYLFFEAFPLVFINNHGFSSMHTGMTFLGLLVGMIMGMSTEPLWKRQYNKLSRLRNDQGKPEYRLPQAMVGGPFVTIAIFWFAFTQYKSVPWIVPILSGVPFGFGMLLVFSGVFTYLVEAYRPFSASALAANGFMRSSFAAAFPLFSIQMYNKLGYTWASALLGFLSLGCLPFPFLFYKYGERLRARSKFAWSDDN
ncbi:major facilitator superfamily domain-containing protein [Dipodascopsis tothii]|uniref:major facilitator superfamily domain-containing protein n=1 Tax=Dipodascopsis tothii TaxID=44089 RepID=UPI0034CF96EF